MGRRLGRARSIGRVNALNQMVVSGGPRLGDVEAGLLAGAIGAGPSVLVGGVACLAGTAAVAARFKQMRAYIPPSRKNAERIHH